MADPTYIFEDGNVYTMVDGQVVASVKEADFDPNSHPINEEVEMPPVPSGIEQEPEGDMCPNCHAIAPFGEHVCPNCGSEIPDSWAQGEAAGEAWRRGEDLPRHSTVTTPNGLRGEVLARTPALWGEEVTVRFENGVIQRIPVDKRLTFAKAEEAPTDQTVVERLDERLAASVSTDRASLLARHKELGQIQREARDKVASSTDSEAGELDRIVVQAAHERLEIESALEAIQAATPVEPFASPAAMPEVEQASMGSSRADWLESIHEGMQAEASERDYEKLMDEGPEAFVASLTAAQLADAGTTRVMAQREINSHLAGADEGVRDGYEKVWLGRVEAKRRDALANFKEEVAEKTASEEISAPDESLFM